MKRIEINELHSLGPNELLEIRIKSKKITVGYFSAIKSIISTRGFVGNAGDTPTSADYSKSVLIYLVNRLENEQIERSVNTISIFN